MREPGPENKTMERLMNRIRSSNKNQNPRIVFLRTILYFLAIPVLLYVSQRQVRGSVEKPMVTQALPESYESAILPVRLTIPIIDVDAKIEYVGLSENGEMDVPKSTLNVGWFALGPRPGENGSAVIAGHSTQQNGENGVFIDLYKLKVGDELYVKDSNGESRTFVVRKIRTYDPGYVEEVFNLNDDAYLNLVTCDGPWDDHQKSYSKRLVIFAKIRH